MQQQARTIAADVEAQKGPKGLADKEIIAVTAYLQRLGTDIRWKAAQPAFAAPAIQATSAFVPVGAAADRTAGKPAVAPATQAK
jgi:hypothetical protein